MAIDGKRPVVLQAESRLDRRPGARIFAQDFARLPRRGKITSQNILVRSCERLAENVAGHRYRTGRAEGFLDISHFDRAAEAPLLEIGGEIPVFKRSLGLALDEFLGDERRRAI